MNKEEQKANISTKEDDSWAKTNKDFLWSVEQRPKQDKVYNTIFGDNIDIQRTERDDDIIMDRKYHVDVNIILPNGALLMFQEKALRYQFYSWHTFTMEYMQNRFTKEHGEFFNIGADYYLHGYINEEEDDFVEWHVISVPRFKLQIKNIESFVKPTQGSNASFIAIPYDCLRSSYATELTPNEFKATAKAIAIN